MEPSNIIPWTFFKDKKNRLFLIVDYNINGKDNGDIVLMEIKQYQPGEKRQFGKMIASKFIARVNNGVLVEVTPKS